MGKIFYFNWEHKSNRKDKSPEPKPPTDEFEYFIYTPEQLNRINRLLVMKELKERSN